MLNLLSTELDRIHPIFVAFPLALLVVSVLLDLGARFISSLRQSARLMLYLGTCGAVLAAVTGLIAHVRYEGTAVSGFIEQHELIAYITTAIFMGLSIWRGRAMRHGKEVGGRWLYAALSPSGTGRSRLHRSAERKPRFWIWCGSLPLADSKAMPNFEIPLERMKCFFK